MVQIVASCASLRRDAPFGVADGLPCILTMVVEGAIPRTMGPRSVSTKAKSGAGHSADVSCRRARFALSNHAAAALMHCRGGGGTTSNVNRSRLRADNLVTADGTEQLVRRVARRELHVRARVRRFVPLSSRWPGPFGLLLGRNVGYRPTAHRHERDPLLDPLGGLLSPRQAITGHARA